jgi:Reverse transcriptase (RNA-dependent DNA polymerase)
MSISESIDKFGHTAVDSITKGIKQMLEKHVWEGVMLDSLTPKQKKCMITSSMFGKAKYTADGIFDKLKSRIVAGGHLQDRDMYDNGSSPTVSTTSVFIVAAKEDRAVATIDFPGAFLNSDMPLDGDHVVFMRINKYLTNVLRSLDPSYKKFVNANGTCVVKLKKALYSCVESAKLWYDKISTDLITLGYKRNNTDICVFNSTEQNSEQTTLAIHVDDMMITCTDDKTIDTIISEIENL